MATLASNSLRRISPRDLKRLKRRAYWREHWPLYAMLLPMVVYFLIASYYPMAGIVLAFKDWRIRLGIWGSPWATNDAGELDLFKHFRTLFLDDDFSTKLLNTLRISGLRILFGFPIPIILTILLNEMRSRKVSRSFQIVSYLPHFISWIVISGILTTMTASKGAFQNFLSSIFGEEVAFFTDDNLFIAMVIISNIWKEAGWSTIIYFAAISSIPVEQYEAAEVDGANRFQRIIHVTLPGLIPAISVNLILTASGVIHGGFDQIYNLYNSTVYGKADIIETYLFRIGISDGNYSLATAMGLFNSTVSLILVLAANKIIKLIGGDGLW